MIKFAETDEEIQKCYDVMSQLRPHIASEDFLPRVRRMMNDFDYRIVYAEDAGEVKAVAGIRISEWLFGGKYLEIDDLVSKDGERSKGYGGDLFDWITGRHPAPPAHDHAVMALLIAHHAKRPA